MTRRSVRWTVLALSAACVLATSCALNAGAIVYVTGDGGDIQPGGEAGTTLDGGDESDGDAPKEGGPPVLVGPCYDDQIQVDAGFCIDKTEVTNAKFVSFLQAVGNDAGGVPLCAGQSILVTGDGADLFTHGDDPVREVSWCAAAAYCEWAGKRLCGSIADGGAVGTADNTYKDASASEWDFACTANGAFAFPYGNTYDASACNGIDNAGHRPVPVGSDPACAGGYPGLLDMSGNVWEWVNACDNGAANTNCKLRGGGFNAAATQMNCNADATGNRVNQAQSVDFGIRCCSNPQ
ncbi:MAG: SUMF1/EgtB/PvdO family nonheme iron enzyme [Polyangiaceae bacterium]